MKRIDSFRMERPNLLQVGDKVKVTEYKSQTMQGLMYIYIIDPAVAMSKGIPARDKLNQLEGTVINIENESSYWTITVEFED